MSNKGVIRNANITCTYGNLEHRGALTNKIVEEER